MNGNTLPIIMGLSAGLITSAVLSPGQQIFAASAAAGILFTLIGFFWMQGRSRR